MPREAIILAGGLGTRLRPVVPDLPKAMAPVAGRPFLEILLRLLVRKKFQRIILSIGYLAEKIIEYFGDCFMDMELVYAMEETPLGTGGATRRALTYCTAGHAFVFNGDTYLDLETEQIETHWRQHQRPIIVTRELADTSRFGRVEIMEGQVCRFLGKGVSGSGYIDAGCYVLPVKILEGFPLGQAFSLETDFLTDAIKEGGFDYFVTHGQFIDIGIPEDYERAQKALSHE